MHDNSKNRVKKANTLKRPRYQEPLGFGASGSNINRGSCYVMLCHLLKETKIGVEDFSPEQEEGIKRHKLHLCLSQELREPPGARSVIQIILRATFKIELVILGGKRDI